MGWLADRFSKKYVMLLTYLLVAAGIPLMFLGTTRLVLYASAAIFGIGLGGDYMIVPLMTAEIFGIEILGRLMGVILTAGGIAEAAAPWVIGHLRDATGNYFASCFVLVVVALLGAIAVLGLPGSEEGSVSTGATSVFARKRHRANPITMTWQGFIPGQKGTSLLPLPTAMPSDHSAV